MYVDKTAPRIAFRYWLTLMDSIDIMCESHNASDHFELIWQYTLPH